MNKQNDLQELNEKNVEKKSDSFFKSRRGIATICLVGGMVIGATMFSLPNADAQESQPTMTEPGAPSNQVIMTEPTQVPPGEVPPESMMVQTDADGTTSYSTDGGETWTEGTPPGATTTTTPDGGQGMVVSSQATPPPVGEEGGTLVKTNEDGSSEYSNDGGETWTEGMPPGAETVTNSDGSQSVVMEKPTE